MVSGHHGAGKFQPGWHTDSFGTLFEEAVGLAVLVLKLPLSKLRLQTIGALTGLYGRSADVSRRGNFLLGMKDK